MLATHAFAQKESTHWYVRQQGLTFKQLPPRLLTDGASQRQNGKPVVMSHPQTGELLFYSDSRQLWNKQHQIMSNGDDLSGSSGHASDQTSIAVPFPNNSNLYYMFTMQEAGGITTAGEAEMMLFYSVIDMQGDNGLGTVLDKNIFLCDSLERKLTAVPFADREGYWLIAHQTDNNCFVVWPITSEGIGEPTVQCIGSVALYELGQIRASPDGKMLAMCHWQWYPRPIDLFKFDDSTGEISEPIAIGHFAQNNTLSFSPDSKLLYIGGYDSTFLTQPDPSGYVNVLHQYDVSSYDSASIASTQKSLVMEYVPEITDMQLGLDGKLYCTTRRLTFGPPVDVTFVVVEAPNLSELEGNIRTKVSFFDLSPRPVRPVLPNFMQHYFEGLEPQNGFRDNDMPCRDNSTMSLHPNPTENLIYIDIGDDCFHPDTNLQLFNVLGQKIMEQKILQARGSTLDLSLLASGCYIAVLQLNDFTIAERIIRL